MAAVIGSTVAAVMAACVAGWALGTAQYAKRLAAETAQRAVQLAGPRVVSPSCWRCQGPLQRATRPHNGQTHYCPRCELWSVVAGA